jgi:hypothetical protein
VIRVFDPFAKPRRIALMVGNELDLRAIDQDFLLRRLELRMSAIVRKDG